MTDIHKELAEALFELERELRALALWDEEPPAPDALASTQPFAVDTLELYQWLQFVFIPRLYRLVEHRMGLPASCSVSPMAEEYFRPRPESGEAVIAVLERIDILVTSAP
ncbi:YqcC family protein [Marinimicrobium sp. C6131]|uniref:YqcC family protein n=1 Tax=Marinimicrobium sp. C6131 TaxID=3022676 RepID=UPI00223D9060|nr:YqcC family protein [Marinimicrobium sp. C6131]UZJ44716.1 YqcC family protein [Marinimicrobium sp. C6131]